MLGIKLSPRQ